MTAEQISESDNLNQAVIQWGYQYLLSHGYMVKSNLPENVINTPWSYVVRFSTSDGDIYLKHTPALLSLEAPIISILETQFEASVPTVIAHNTQLHCFLMKDAGRPLREILKKQFNTKLYCKAINQFTLLQLAAANHTNVFLEIGVPDWRLDKFPDLYKELLSQKNILIEDGLSEIEIIELKALFPKVLSLCQKLSGYSIKQTIVQPDFSDNNILIDTLSQKFTTIDLGEIVISHPFFSLVNCLQQIKKHYRFDFEDEPYLRIRDACLENYKNIISEKHLSEAFEITQTLWLIYDSLANDRLRLACDKDQLIAFQRRGRLTNTLKEFIARNSCQNLL